MPETNWWCAAGRSVRQCVTLVFLGGVAATGCSPRQQATEISSTQAISPAQFSPHQQPRPTPGPGFLLPIDSMPADSVMRYIRRLEFADSVWQKDAQRLMLIDSSGNKSYGPYATIRPEIGANALTPVDRVAGRIVAEIEIAGAYLPLKISAPGKYYVWVDGTLYKGGLPLPVGMDPLQADSATVRLFAADGTQVGRLGATLSYHAPGQAHDAAARWIFKEDDEDGWTACDSHTCCRIKAS